MEQKNIHSPRRYSQVIIKMPFFLNISNRVSKIVYRRKVLFITCICVMFFFNKNIYQKLHCSSSKCTIDLKIGFGTKCVLGLRLCHSIKIYFWSSHTQYLKKFHFLCSIKSQRIQNIFFCHSSQFISERSCTLMIRNIFLYRRRLMRQSLGKLDSLHYFS